MTAWSIAITFIAILTGMTVFFGLVGYLAEAAPKAIARWKHRAH